MKTEWKNLTSGSKLLMQQFKKLIIENSLIINQNINVYNIF